MHDFEGSSRDSLNKKNAATYTYLNKGKDILMEELMKGTAREDHGEEVNQSEDFQKESRLEKERLGGFGQMGECRKVKWGRKYS